MNRIYLRDRTLAESVYPITTTRIRKCLSNNNDQNLSKSTGTLMDVIQSNTYHLVGQMPIKSRLYQNCQGFYSAPIIAE